MEIQLGGAEVAVSEACPLRLKRARYRVLHCTEGRLWITCEGRAADTHLSAGESLRVECNGLVIVGSLGSGRVRVA